MEFDARIPGVDKYIHKGDLNSSIGTARINEDGTVRFVLNPSEENEALFDLIQKDTLKGISLFSEGEPMDELVYFSASFHCIPLSTADNIREMLMQMMPDTQFNFDYSKPIIQEED